MTGKIELISKTYTTDSIGQKIPTDVSHEVFCDISNVSASEFARAGSIGLKPSFLFKVWSSEYKDEDIVVYNNVRYSVYRTYKSENGRMELYVQKDVQS